MPKFSSGSQARLNQCDTRLVTLFERIVLEYDCSILCGHRTEKEQNTVVSAGMSETPWPQSKHNSLPSKGVDVAPYPIDWGNTKRFYHFGGFVQGVAHELGVAIRWGGDWDGDKDLDDQSFFDLVHFELKG